jgi:chitin disaccharide deacetylase
MPTSRLALHADDFGLNQAVSDGIVHGFRHGLLTSTSLMSNAPDAARALSLWKELLTEQAAGQLPSAGVRRQLAKPACPFDLGVHLNMTKGRPLTGDKYPAELLDAAGRFPGVFSLFARLRRSGEKLRNAIRDEWQRQIGFLCDHGLRPTHINGHQYVEMLPAVAGFIPQLLEQFAIKAVRVAWEPGLIRNTALHGLGLVKWPLAEIKHLFAAQFRKLIDAQRLAHPDAFYGTAHAGHIDLALLRLFLASSRQHPFIEVGLHPGQAAAETSPEAEANGWHDPLALARPAELQMLASAELAQCLTAAGRQLGRLQLLTA